jgi:hypothetical protein
MLIKPDIISEISKYIVLKPAGKNLRGSCPLHAERTPSFFIRPYSQTFRCYGCNASGDVIQFVMLIENLDFKGACKHLGIELKPTRKTWRELEKERLVRQFKDWCYYRYDELCVLYRCIQKAKDQARTESDVEVIAEYYHQESLWLQQIEIFENGDVQAKLDLFRESATI